MDFSGQPNQEVTPLAERDLENASRCSRAQLSRGVFGMAGTYEQTENLQRYRLKRIFGTLRQFPYFLSGHSLGVFSHSKRFAEDGSVQANIAGTCQEK